MATTDLTSEAVERLVEAEGCVSFPRCGRHLVWNPIGRTVYEIASHERKSLPPIVVYEDQPLTIEGSLADRYNTLCGLEGYKKRRG